MSTRTQNPRRKDHCKIKSYFSKGEEGENFILLSLKLSMGSSMKGCPFFYFFLRMKEEHLLSKRARNNFTPDERCDFLISQLPKKKPGSLWLLFSLIHSCKGVSQQRRQRIVQNSKRWKEAGYFALTMLVARKTKKRDACEYEILISVQSRNFTRVIHFYLDMVYIGMNDVPARTLKYRESHRFTGWNSFNVLTLWFFFSAREHLDPFGKYKKGKCLWHPSSISAAGTSCDSDLASSSSDAANDRGTSAAKSRQYRRSRIIAFVCAIPLLHTCSVLISICFWKKLRKKGGRDVEEVIRIQWISIRTRSNLWRCWFNTTLD